MDTVKVKWLDIHKNFWLLAVICLQRPIVSAPNILLMVSRKIQIHRISQAKIKAALYRFYSRKTIMSPLKGDVVVKTSLPEWHSFLWSSSGVIRPPTAFCHRRSQRAFLYISLNQRFCAGIQGLETTEEMKFIPFLICMQRIRSKLSSSSDSHFLSILLPPLPSLKLTAGWQLPVVLWLHLL